MKKRVTDSLKLKWILLAGTLVRLFYIVATPVVQQRQYDLGSVSVSEGIFTGHLGYIFYLFTNRALPDFDPREVYQFFHPPLHHILSAAWMKIVSIFSDSQQLWIESLQVLPFLYSVAILLVLWQICKEFHISEKAQCCVMAIFVFHPSLIFMSGSINNDCLALLFQFLSIWFFLRWYHNRTCGNIVFLALSLALGVLTKLSVGQLAVPIGIMFLVLLVGAVREWRKTKDNSNLKKLFLQYMVFGVVCVPLGIMWALRCFILYGMPFTYVNSLPVQSWQYVGDYTFLERFFIPNLKELFLSLSHGSLGFGENVWVQLFRTAVLGECDMSTFPLIGKMLAMFLIVFGFILALWAFVLFVKEIIIDKEKRLNTGIRCFWILTYVVIFALYLNFCYGFPHQCTMNFRYIVPTILFPGVAVGLWLDKTRELFFAVWMKRLVCIFSILSCLMCVVWVVAI